MGAISYNAVEFYDRDFGPYMVPVTPPGAPVSPSSTLVERSLGRAPGRLTQSGWAGVDLRDPKARCLDWKTAKLWDEWGANVGFVAGEDGYVILDNDQGTDFTQVLIERFVKLGVSPLRRYVLDPKHHRDAFVVRVLDFIGEPVKLSSRDFQFRKGNLVGKFQILATGKQAVISGTHRETKAPYVWDRTIDSIQDVPILSEDQFEMFLQMFIAKLQDQGWSPGHPMSQNLVSQKPAWQLPHTTSQSLHHKLSSGEIDALIQGARDLLAQIPNRDVPLGETPNDIDRWLDEYENWIKIAYDLAAYLGGAAETPEAEDLFTEWSDGRSQVKQKSRSLWISVIRQPLRSGIAALPSLVRSLTPRETGFPPLDPNDPALATPIWNRMRDEWAYLSSKTGFVHLDSAMIVPRQAFSDLFAYQVADLALELGFKRRKGVKLLAADMFVAQPDMQAIEALTYAPGDAKLVPGKALPVFNKWRPASIRPMQVSAKDVKPWLDHVEFVLGSASERDRFVKWSAFIAQCPEEKPNWHFLILSQQGIGKDTMVEPLKAAVGNDNWKEEQIEHLAGTFNVGAETKLIVISEAGQPKSWEAHKVETVLKQVLSRPPDEIWINQKNVPHYKIPNRLAAILFSNEASPVSLDPDQRRLHVLNCRHIQPKPASYYQGLWDWFNKGGRQMTAAYLHSYTLLDADRQEFIGGTAPSSVAKSLLEQQSMNPYQDALEEIIRDARDGLGAFPALVATIDQLVDHIGLKMRKPTPQMVRGLLMDMENRKTGVHRLKVDPREPTRCAPIRDQKRNIHQRLWALADKTANGQDWKTLLDPEIIALWRPPGSVVAKPSPSSSKPPPDFPDQSENDEAI